MKETTEDSVRLRYQKQVEEQKQRYETAIDTERRRYCLTPSCVRVADRLLANMNTSVKPCEDFWTYACGGWLRRHENDADYGVVDALNEKLSKQVRALLKARPAPSTTAPSIAAESTDMFQTKVSVLYDSCMKEADEYDDDDGMYSLNEILDSFGGWSALGTTHRFGYKIDCYKYICMYLWYDGAETHLRHCSLSHTVGKSMPRLHGFCQGL